MSKAKNKKEKKPISIPVTQSTQTNFPVEEIRDGIIVTKDKRYLKILEFSPINFLLRSPLEQSSIIYSFAGVFKTAPAHIQFKTISRKADMGKYLSILQRERDNEPNELCRALQDEYIDFVERISKNEGVSRRFFIIIEHSCQLANRNQSFEIIASEMTTATTNVLKFMRDCGNEVIEPPRELQDVVLAELFYEICCRHLSESIPFKVHAQEIVQKYVELRGNNAYIPVTDLFAPKWIDFKNKSYVVCDDKYYSFLYLPSDAYNVRVVPGWLSPLINSWEGIDVDIFFSKQDKERMQQKIGQHIRMNRATMNDTSDTSSSFDDVGNAISSGFALKSALSSGDDFFYMNLLVTVVAGSLQELVEKTQFLQRIMIGLDMKLKPCTYQMEQAFMSALPLCKLDKSIFDKSKRNITTSNAASVYPFASYEMQDENGILLGVSKMNNSLAIVDNFNSRKYKNANIAIVGTSGAGKTFTMCCIAERMRLKNIQVFMIAPEKGHEFSRLCNGVGGQFIRISAGSSNRINIMAIQKKLDNSNELLDEATYEDSILSEKIQQVRIFFNLIIKDISYEENQLLDEILINTYKKFGITHDNLSLLSDPHNPDSPYVAMPTLEDVYNEMLLGERSARMAVIVKPYVSGSMRAFCGQTNVDLNNKFIVMDLSALTGDMKTVGMFVALDYMWNKIREDRIHKKAIFIDEVWQLIGSKSDALAAGYVLDMFKLIRGYGGAAVAATQDINDFFALEDGKYGKGIINNSKTKIVLNLEMEEAVRVKQTLNLTQREMLEITKLARGNGLIVANTNNMFVEFKATQREIDMITTDRDLLSKLAKKKEASEKHKS